MPASQVKPHSAWPVGPQIEYAETVNKLPGEAERVLSQLFTGCERVTLVQELGGGFTQSRVLVAEAIHPDGGSDLPLVLKIGPAWLIEQEQEAYHRYICDKLSGRIELVNTANARGWGALGYRLAGDGQFKHESLAQFCDRSDLGTVEQVLSGRLFKRLETLWRNASLSTGAYPGSKYDLLLPVHLVIEAQPLPSDVTLLRLSPGRAASHQPASGDWLRVEGFVITELDVAAGEITVDLPPHGSGPQCSHRLRLTGVRSIDRYQVGQKLPPMDGIVRQTRLGRLQAEVEQIAPTSWQLDLACPTFTLAGSRSLPNPLVHLRRLLAGWPPVKLAYLHGDLNLENVLVDPETGDVTLIDFARAGVDHVLHDLLHLEFSVITELLTRALLETGEPAAIIVSLFYERLHQAATTAPQLYTPPRLLHPALKKPFVIIAAIRRAAQPYLQQDWREYYRGLALYLIGALKFKDLADHPAAPLPKQLAWLGAAAATELWLTAEDRPPPLPSTPSVARLKAELRAGLNETLGLDLDGDTICLPDGAGLLNPLARLPELLEPWLGPHLARVHGKLQPLPDLNRSPERQIQAATARPDQALHRLLALETALVSQHLAPALIDAVQPAAALHFLFYERLHRAGLGTSEQFAPPKALAPVLTPAYLLLAAIRQQAATLLPSRADWQEYYQGLAIYLLGYLRLAPVDTVPAIFLAATVAVDLWRRPDERPRPACPYRGLHAFREADAPFFFGREQVVADLAAELANQPFIAVTGPSGSGKSSAVLAGLVPRLRQNGGWQIATFRPGSSPFRELVNALAPLLDLPADETAPESLVTALQEGRRQLADLSHSLLDQTQDAGRLLLIIDQFEELYTLCPNPDTRQRFIDVLLGSITAGDREPFTIQNSQFKIVLTLRADFMGKALEYRPLADALQANVVLLLGAMSRPELARSIEYPAESLGLSFEAGLVDRILDDVGQEPGRLPLLEFALTQLWQLQTNGRLTWVAYDAIGRVSGAVTHYAEHVYGDLTPLQQEQARRIFTQLVQPGAGTEDTRRLASRGELAGAWPLVQHLAGRRLVVTNRNAGGDEVVELVHEALIQNWERLAGWMDEDRTFRAWQERLRVSLAQWQANEREQGGLLRGAPLAEAEGWLNDRQADLSQDERAFIRRSVALRDQERIAREAAQQRQLEQAQALAEAQRRRAEEQTVAAARLRRRAIWLGTALVLLLLALVGTIILFRFWTSAEDRRLAAEQSALSAEQRRATADFLADVAEQRQATAEISARLAETAEANAQAAAATASAAQQAAEAGQQVAVVARQTAQVNLATARAQQALAEVNEREAVLAQQAAIAGEATAQAAEHLALAARQTAQAGEATAEANRATAQARRDQAEAARQQAAAALAAAEAAKQAAEAARQAAERAAEQAEQELQQAEAAASQAQATQATAEALRDEAADDLAQIRRIAAIIGNIQSCPVDPDPAADTRPTALAFDGTHLWVANKGTRRITKLAAGDCTIVDSYPTGNSSPIDIVYDGNFIWVLTLGNELIKIDIDSGPTAIFPDRTTEYIPSALLHDGTALWVTSQNFSGTLNKLNKIEPTTGQILETYDTGDSPADLAFDGRYIWVTNENDDTVSKIEAATGSLAGVYPVGERPKGVTVGGPYLWVANYASHSISKIRLSDGALVGTLETGSGPRTVTFDGHHVWSTNENDNTLTGLKQESGERFLEVPTGRGPTAALFDGANIWVAAENDGVVQKIPVTIQPVGHTPVALATQGDHLWVANQADHSLSKLSSTGDAPLQTFTLVDQPVALIAANDNIWTAHGDRRTVSKISSQDGTILGVFASGDHPADLLGYDGSQIWVAGRQGQTISRLKEADGRLLGTTQVGEELADLLYDGRRMWAADAGDQSLLKLDSDGTLLDSYPLNVSPETFVYDGASFWVAYPFINFPTVFELRLQQVDAGDGSLIATYPTELPLGYPLLAYDGTDLWLASRSGSNATFDLGVKMAGNNPLNQTTFRLCKAPGDLIEAAGGVWVACQEDDLVMKIPGAGAASTAVGSASMDTSRRDNSIYLPLIKKTGALAGRETP